MYEDEIMVKDEDIIAHINLIESKIPKVSLIFSVYSSNSLFTNDSQIENLRQRVMQYVVVRHLKLGEAPHHQIRN